MKHTNGRWMAVMVIGFLANGFQAQDKPVFKNDKERNSYCIGINTGRSMKGVEIDVDFDFLIRGVKDAYADQPGVTDKEIQEAMAAVNKEITFRRQEKRRLLTEKNKHEGEGFLAENKTKPGVITLPSGLQYKILTEGQGESPTGNDVVTVNYRGMLVDGTEFDSSYKRGQPAKFNVNGVIKGWTEALELMKPGAKWELFIPSDLAYGPSGHGSQIGPDSTLKFEVELVSAEPAPNPSATPAPAQPVTSDIIKVPSKEEMAKGAKIEVIKAGEVEKAQKQQQQKQQSQPTDKK